MKWLEDMPGRKIMPIDYNEVTELAASGLTQQQIAYCLDVSESTARRQFDVNEQFRIAYEKGRALGIAKVVNAAFTRALEPSGTIDRIFWLKNVAGWQDKQETQVTGDITVNIQSFSGQVEKPNNDANECINAEYNEIEDE